jgi:hypothetical protein
MLRLIRATAPPSGSRTFVVEPQHASLDLGALYFLLRERGHFGFAVVEHKKFVDSILLGRDMLDRVKMVCV